MSLDRPIRALPGIPTAHQLKAALAAGRAHVSGRGTPDPGVALGYARLATDGLYSVRDLWLGDAILRGAALLADRDGEVVLSEDYADLTALPEEEACNELLSRYLALQQPLWLVAATSDDRVAWELVPDSDLGILTATLPDPERREALLLAAARRVDPDRDKRTGDLAEEQVAAACRAELEQCNRPDLAARVRRVSLVSDQLGYDVVAPRVESGVRRLEIKGTRAQGTAFTVTLSRGEARQALRDADWFLVACRVASDDIVSLVGWCQGRQLEPFMPADPEQRGHWRSVEIALDEAMLTPGLPPC